MRNALRDVLVIVERLAHPHEHDVGDHAAVTRRRPLADGIARQHELADDLAGLEVAHELLRAGMAELAGERAADLRGDAQGAAVLLRNVHGLDEIAVGEPQEPLARAVRGLLVAHGHGTGEREVPLERLAQPARERGHRGEVGRAAVIDPVPELAGAEALEAEDGELLLELRAAEPDQVLLRLGRALDGDAHGSSCGKGGGC